MRVFRPFAGLVLLLSLFLVGQARAAAPEAVSSAPPRTPAEEKAAFHLPEGFEAQLVAAEPDIHKPLNIAFDDRGRLWVTETLEYPFPAAEGTTPRDGVKILSDFGPDGRARKIETFVTGLNIPIGIMPMPGGESALVHSIPYVYRIDRSGKKEPLYQTYGFKDTHGMTNNFTWGFDGWIYACHGFSNESHVKGGDKQEITMQSGNVYRMKPDGSHLEYVTHGQVNPFGLSFDPLGNLYSCDCHTKPIYQLLRGGYYPSFGKPDDGLGFGPEMTTSDHGSTAISGIVYYAADHFPKEYLDTAFIGNVVTNRINHDKIEWHGATPKAVTQPDFLVSDDPWFRPAHLVLGPDGALYVSDFYNRIIGHYEVPLLHPGRDRERGRIWRIVYKGKDGKGKAPLPEGLWDPIGPGVGQPHAEIVASLSDQLGHPNLAVRIRAANRLVWFLTGINESPGNAEGKVFSGSNAWQKAQMLWVLQRLGKLSDERLTQSLQDPDRLVRIHAIRILGERAELTGSFSELARKALKDDDALVRRVAAEALARHAENANIRPLLALRASIPAEDTHLTYAVRMSLRNQLRGDDAWDHLDPKALTDREREDIADVAPGVPSGPAARFLLERIKTADVPQGVLVRYVHHIARYGDAGKDGSLLAYLKEKGGDTLARVDLLKTYQQGLQERGAAFDEEAKAYALSLIDAMLGSSKAPEIGAGIALAGAFKLSAATDRLTTLVLKGKIPEPRRVEALVALASIDAKGAIPVLTRVLSDPSRPQAIRDRAANLLGSGGQADGQAALLGALPTAPEKLQGAIAAALVAKKAGAEALLDAIAAGKASARLLQENRVAGPLGNAGIPNLAERLKTLLKGLPPADKATDALITARRTGFVRSKAEASAGLKVFETNCATCHQIGGKGAKVGPQLDGVGLRGMDRLLEDVLDPSRNVDQTFRLTTLALKDGRVVSGLLLREEGEILVLADAQGKDVRVARDQVEERTIAPLSPMPANMAEQIPEGDFYKLIAYLLSQRPSE